MIRREEVDKIAVLARLALEDSEADRLAVELGSILGYMEKLEPLSLDESPKRVGLLRYLGCTP